MEILIGALSLLIAGLTWLLYRLVARLESKS
jgi:hypothetical protein